MRCPPRSKGPWPELSCTAPTLRASHRAPHERARHRLAATCPRRIGLRPAGIQGAHSWAGRGATRCWQAAGRWPPLVAT
eukprot:scaffold273225_cov28-Tisochrysis_lutea.AAC.2